MEYNNRDLNLIDYLEGLKTYMSNHMIIADGSNILDIMADYLVEEADSLERTEPNAKLTIETWRDTSNYLRKINQK